MNSIKTLKYKLIKRNQQTIDTEIKVTINEDKEAQMYIIHKALKQQLNNNRVRNAHTKTRSEVRGGGKKPWKQKGTGRARAGSNRSPLWNGGGIIFGPKKKIYSSKINKKERKLAINSLISNKINQTLITEEILSNIEKPNTKKALTELKQLGIELHKSERLLIVVDKKDLALNLSYRNLRHIEILEAKSMNILSLLKADKVLMTYSALQKLNYRK
uniref:Large ribosomal subunit protein uL4c n=1 Tax=Polysiphonia sertularioides TaxID=945028 RepID=A0A1Z1MGY8_9FLOR|nr:ribosomal protein L4 [Polysiphonia sertularioides]